MKFIDDNIEILVAASFAITIIFFICAIVSYEQDWIKYKAEHKCSLINKVEDTFILVPQYTGANGSFIMVPQVVPGESTYKCDNGEITR